MHTRGHELQGGLFKRFLLKVLPGAHVGVELEVAGGHLVPKRVERVLDGYGRRLWRCKGQRA